MATKRVSADTKTWKEWAADGSIAFWDCDDGREQLRHEAFEDAVEHEVDDELSPGCDVEAVVREKYPDGLTVFGFRRREVTQEWLAGEASWLAEAFAERLEDEYGDHLHGVHEVFDEEQEQSLAADFLLLLEKWKPILEPWQCEQAAKVDLSLDELLALLRELNPD